MQINHKKIFKFRAGQSLIEVVVSLAVVVLLAVSLVSTSIFVQKASKSAQNNTQASKLVQQNIEEIRIFRDRNPSGFDALPSSGCDKLVATDPNPANWTLSSLSSCATPPPGAEVVVLNNRTFNRWLSFASPNSNEKSITVVVSWTDSSGLQSVSNATFLSRPCTGQIGGSASPCP